MTNYSANMMKIILKSDVRIKRKAARNFVLFLIKLSTVLSEEIHSDFLKIFTSNLDNNNVPPFMKLFWHEQQKCVQTSRNGVRYHPMLIRFCLNLVSKSPSACEEPRYNGKDGTGFLIQAQPTETRDFRNYIKP